MPDWPRTTYWGALDRAARLWPDTEAVVLPGERITFSALRALVLRRAANLHRLGLRRGDSAKVQKKKLRDFALTDLGLG
jgi:non-ribosomal peptide synthetase component E (peptide arylation enzyme)